MGNVANAGVWTHYHLTTWTPGLYSRHSLATRPYKLCCLAQLVFSQRPLERALAAATAAKYGSCYSCCFQGGRRDSLETGLASWERVRKPAIVEKISNPQKKKKTTFFVYAMLKKLFFSRCFPPCTFTFLHTGFFAHPRTTKNDTLNTSAPSICPIRFVWGNWLLKLIYQ